MRTIDQIRRENLLTLISRLGSVQGFADKIERSPAQVSQWKNGSLRSGSGKPATIESDSARMIEQAFSLEQGWMDHDHQLWPLSAELLLALQQVKPSDRRRAENIVRAQLEMDPLPADTHQKLPLTGT